MAGSQRLPARHEPHRRLAPTRGHDDVHSAGRGLHPEVPALEPLPRPPAARSPIGGSANPGTGNDMSEQVAAENKASTNRNLGEQGRQGNIKQNTTHQGFQQDR